MAIVQCPGWRIETGQESEAGSKCPQPVIENPLSNTLWYYKYFLGRDHENYVCRGTHPAHAGKGSVSPENAIEFFAMSVIRTPLELDNDVAPQYRVVVWRKNDDIKILINVKKKQLLKPKKLLATVCPELAKLKKLKIRKVTSPDIMKDIQYFENMSAHRQYKFGVLMTKAGQSKEEEMFHNLHGHEGFVHLLEALGHKVSLEGFAGFRGGLDVKPSLCTGTHSYYTVYEGNEVMYQVSTLLPYQPENEQQVERKRHLGNDVCCVVFQESTDTPFAPDCIATHFTHVYIVINCEKDASGHYVYRVCVASQLNVLPFGPVLPNPAVFYNSDDLRSFVLTKLINGERSALMAPAFSGKLQRTCQYLLTTMWDNYADTHTGSIPLEEFKAAGQRLRTTNAAMEIVNVTGARAVTPVCLIGQSVISGVTCGDQLTSDHGGVYLVGTEGGIGMFCAQRSENPFVIVVEKLSVYAMQYVRKLDLLLVLGSRRPRKETSSLLLIRNVSKWVDTMLNTPATETPDYSYVRIEVIGKHLGYNFTTIWYHSEFYVCLAYSKCLEVFVFRAADVSSVVYLDGDSPSAAESESASARQRSKSYVADGQTHSESIRDRSATSIGGTRGGESCTPDPLESTPDYSAYSLVQYKDYLLPSPSKVLTFAEVESKLQIIVGYNTAFDIIDVETAAIQELYFPREGRKMFPVAAIVFPEHKDVLLCYDTSAIFVNFKGKKNKKTEIQWTTVPTAISYFFPYLIAFAPTMLEVRSVVNGNVLQTLYFDFLTCLSMHSDHAVLVSSSPRPGMTSCFDIRRAELQNLKEEDLVRTNDPSPSSPSPRNQTVPEVFDTDSPIQ